MKSKSSDGKGIKLDYKKCIVNASISSNDGIHWFEDNSINRWNKAKITPKSIKKTQEAIEEGKKIRDEYDAKHTEDNLVKSHNKQSNKWKIQYGVSIFIDGVKKEEIKFKSEKDAIYYLYKNGELKYGK